MSIREWVDSRRSAAWLKSCTRVGPDPRLRGRPDVRNFGLLHIGARFSLSSQPVVSHLVVASGAVLEIGDDVAIGHGAAIASQARLRIGDSTQIGPFVLLADSDFHVVGDRNAVPEPRPVEIGRRVRVGARVTILPGSTIGDGAIVLAGSTVAGTIGANLTVSGVPARAAAAKVTEAAPANRGSATDLVRELVQRTLGGAQLPQLGDGPEQLPEWDSLGSLRLLLALEDELGVRVTEQAMAGVRTVADLMAFVDAGAASGNGR
jgi:acetyltransferase-like isoleucine patch superfamily enzyme/acyl carrier protein